MSLKIQTQSEKKIAIMQPYLFPYIGYFQLICASDFFVFLDDVQYIKRGWINKNKINTKNGEVFFTIPIKKSSRESKINEVFCSDLLVWRDKFFKTLEINYSSKKYNLDFLHFLKENFISQEIASPKISEISIHSVKLVLKYLEIEFNYSRSSVAHQALNQKGVERIIAIVKENQGTQYINLPGGKEIYTKNFFSANNLKLKFIEVEPTSISTTDAFNYSSIIDTVMLFGKEKSRDLVLNYRLSER